jgi:hypothetical protein
LDKKLLAKLTLSSRRQINYRRGALLELAELHGPDEQLGSPDPLKT